MLRAFPIILMALTFFAMSSRAAEQRVIKVLPHFMDQEGRHANSPSLFERDAYQAWLRKNPEEQSGIRYDIQWQSFISGEYVMKLELIGRVADGVPKTKTIERTLVVKNSRRSWDAIRFEGEEFRAFGQVVAWRVSIWQGEEMLTKKQSFLWE
jgi:hypothetical protein